MPDDFIIPINAKATTPKWTDQRVHTGATIRMLLSKLDYYYYPCFLSWFYLEAFSHLLISVFEKCKNDYNVFVMILYLKREWKQRDFVMLILRFKICCQRPTAKQVQSAEFIIAMGYP